MTAAAERPKPTAARRAARAAAWIVAGVTALSLAAAWIDSHFSASALDAKLAELDATDSGWRHDDIVAARPKPAPGRNSAAVVAAVAAMLVPPRIKPSDKPFVSVAANVRLGGTADAARATVAANTPALRLAMTHLDYPEEGFWPEDETQVPFRNNDDQIKVLAVANVLCYASALRAEDGDADAALRAARAALHAGRAVGSGLGSLPMMFRGEAAYRAFGAMARALAQGTASDAELKACAEAAGVEEAYPLYRRWLRGKRALQQAAWEDLTTGRLSVDRHFLDAHGVSWRHVGPWRYVFGYRRSQVRRHYLGILAHFDEMLRLESLPPKERIAAERAAEEALERMAEGDLLVGIHLGVQHSAGKASRFKEAQARGMLVALAAERFRLARGAWPAAVADLAPAYLAAVPADPYDGEPIRFTRTADGVVVYCLGDNGTDEGGKVV